MFALDDTPTPRYGPLVQGAGVHHNPSPGPAGRPFVYEHVWVVLGLLAAHPVWGVIALPVLARLYLHQKDLPNIPESSRPAFAAKVELAVDLMRWATIWLGFRGKPLWVVAEGADAQAAFLQPMIERGVVVVSRLRKDAALWTLPELRPVGRRDRPPIYGKHRIVLAKRAIQPGGWRTNTFAWYGKTTAKRYQTFLATWHPVGRVMRVVLVDEPEGGRAFFGTDPEASVAEILGLVADRFSRETCFRNLKQIVGAGQQQVRKREANVGSFHLCLGTLTMTEYGAWERSEREWLGPRRESPWDLQPRRPSHADQRRAWQREFLAEEMHTVLGNAAKDTEIQELTQRLLNLAA